MKFDKSRARFSIVVRLFVKVCAPRDHVFLRFCAFCECVGFDVCFGVSLSWARGGGFLILVPHCVRDCVPDIWSGDL